MATTSATTPQTASQGAFPATDNPYQLLFADVVGELAATRRVLERVPDGKDDWQPHPKSMSLGRLATHVAELSGLAMTVLTTDELDWATSDYKPRVVSSTAERLALFDEMAAAMKKGLQAADWDTLGKRWVMRAGDQIYIDDYKANVIRSVGISHVIHHRGQLGVYLRLLGESVPSVYGPTADEGPGV